MKFDRKGALSVLFTLFFTPLAWAENTTHDVIVVGAGSAGLYAAKTLIADGYDVLIIEATDRIGGRIYSEWLGGTRIELGAEEHYGKRGGNPVWSAIRGEYGPSVYVNGYQGLEAYSLTGGTETCWTKASAVRPCAGVTGFAEFEDLYDWYWRPSNHPDDSTTLADDVWGEYGVAPGDPTYHWYDSGFAGGEYATSLDKLGARSLALQDNEWDLTESIKVIGNKDLGYSDALETVWWSDVIDPSNSDLLLSSPVVEINTSGDDVIVTTTDVNDDLHLHAARQVIVTVSIGVLQAEMIDFVPDLDGATVATYNGIGIDQGMKVAIRFSSVWWETEGDPLSWLVTEGVAGACWVPTDYKVGSPDHILMCYPMGQNASDLNDLAVDAGGGEDGDAAIVAAILADLDATLPQAPANAASTNYIDAVVQNWGAHPYTLGAYSYPKVGTYTTASDNLRADLQAPVANNRIFFAGEGTHVTHPATVVGALHEGERAANEVHAVNGNPNNPPPLPGGGGGDPTSLSVASIVAFTQGEGGGVKRPSATVNILDNLGNPVSGATVFGEFTGDFLDGADPETFSVVTDGAGDANFASSVTKKGKLKFTFCVTDVTHELTFNPGDDCDTN
jgi:monoamine oxidase